MPEAAASGLKNNHNRKENPTMDEQEMKREIDRLETESAARMREINRLRAVVRELNEQIQNAWTPRRILTEAVDQWKSLNEGEPSGIETIEGIESICDSLALQAIDLIPDNQDTAPRSYTLDDIDHYAGGYCCRCPEDDWCIERVCPLHDFIKDQRDREAQEAGEETSEKRGNQ
jgi:hypothetical protein